MNRIPADVTAVSTHGIKTPRYETVDIAKAIAMILVVIGHYMPDESPDGYKFIVKLIYSFHMPLFFFVSGFIYQATWKPISYGKFLAKKFKRLIIPYFTVSIIVILTKMVAAGILKLESPVDAFALVRMFYEPAAGIYLWFVWALWWMMVIIPLFRTPKSRLVLFAIAIVLNVIDLPGIPILSISRSISYLVWFSAGCLAADYIHHPVRLCKNYIFFICVALFVIAHYILLPYQLEEASTVPLRIMKKIAVISAIGFTLILSYKLLKKGPSSIKRALLRISTTTYIIYLFHTTFEGLGKGILDRFGIPSAETGIAEWVVIIVFVVSLGVTGPYLLDRLLLRRSRITRLLFGIPEPKKVKANTN